MSQRSTPRAGVREICKLESTLRMNSVTSEAGLFCGVTQTLSGHSIDFSRNQIEIADSMPSHAFSTNEFILENFAH